MQQGDNMSIYMIAALLTGAVILIIEQIKEFKK